MKSRVAFIGLVALALTAMMVSPLFAGSESPLDTVYREQADMLHSKLRLSQDQSSRLEALFGERKERERHLRRQMRTTYTPEQQARAHKMWQESSKPHRLLTKDERQRLRTTLGVNEAQQRQFEAYQQKLAEHREETLLLATQLLDPSQRVKMREVSFAL